jgi:two-component system response regulator QseB
MTKNSDRSLNQGPEKEISTRILVVDADVSVGEMIRDNYSGEGIQVDWCRTGGEAHGVDLTDYQILLLDLSIDNNQGINLIEQIRQIRTFDKVGIIAYSVKMSPETIISALNAGADDYLIKPFSIRELKARVRSMLRRRPTQK